MSSSAAAYAASTGNCSAASVMTTFALALLAESSRKPSELGPPLRWQSEYDFVIVGGGAGGSVVARRLAEMGKWTVLLIEAGREEPLEADIPAFLTYLPETDLSWGYTSQPQDNGPCASGCPLTNGKVLGGSTVISRMTYTRGHPDDYARWNVTGWSYEEALPLFKKSENNGNPEVAADTTYHATGGLLDVNWLPYKDENVDIFMEALDEMGLPLVDPNGSGHIGRFVAQCTSRNGERRSANRAFVQSYKGSNLHVLTKALVSKVKIDPITKTALGVEYLDINGRERIVRARKEVILSAGTYNSPQLLMLSGVGPRSHLEDLGIAVIKDLPVGKNFQDHVGTFPVTYTLSETATSPVELSTMLSAFSEYLQANRSGPFTSTGHLTTLALIRSALQEQNDPRPDIQMTFIGGSPPQEADSRCTQPVKLEPFYNTVKPLTIVLHPESRGEILLNSTDVRDSPLVFLNIFKEESDVRTAVEGIKLAIKLGETSVFKERGINVTVDGLEQCRQAGHTSEYEVLACVARSTVVPISHSVGTCALGSVLDANLRVLGVRGLRVVDASAIPNTPSGSPSAAVIMVAERAAQLIGRSHGKI